MEIMDEAQMKVVNLSGLTSPRKWKELPTLFFKFSGTKASVKENIAILRNLWNQYPLLRLASTCRPSCGMRMFTGSCTVRREISTP